MKRNQMLNVGPDERTSKLVANALDELARERERERQRGSGVKRRWRQALVIGTVLLATGILVGLLKIGAAGIRVATPEQRWPTGR